MGPLLPEEVKQLALALLGAFPGNGELDDLTRLELDTPLANITAADTMPEMIKRVIIWFSGKGRTEELIRTAMDKVPGNEILQLYGQGILDRIQRTAFASWYRAAKDPHETCFVPGQQGGLQAFISRPALRSFTRHLNSALNNPVLIVNGVTNSGKTYSFQLVAYVRRAFREQGDSTYSLARVDLADEIPGTYEPETLVSDIANQLGWDTASMPKRPSTRYVKEICRWLLGKSNQGSGAVLVVLDGFHHADLYGETRKMMQELILQVSANSSNIRLILLNFPRELMPPNLPGPVQYEDVSQVTATELAEFFSELYKQKGRAPAANVIDVVVQSVMAQVAAAAPNNYNELLNQTVTKAAESLR
jgi:hypothetical protein